MRWSGYCRPNANLAPIPRLGRSGRFHLLICRRAWPGLARKPNAHTQLPHVLVHGDIHEDQLLALDGQLTGILDWETVRIDHPFWDFDFAEWGTGLWRRHRLEFSRLWSVA
jgi:aminoglycoside phosphotransferase (APT) family kinase protein